MMFHPSVAQWLTLSQSDETDVAVMRVRTERRRHATDGREGVFTICSAPVWVNVLPITTDGNIVMVEQFRHGVNKPTLEIPGGIVHADEEPSAAAVRECVEETGWSSTLKPVLVGAVEPNPAFMDNLCYVYVWNNCEHRNAQQLDPLEDVVVHVITPETFTELLIRGVIQHSLVLSAITLASLAGHLTIGSRRINNG